ncbi:hypothetical protein BDW62DRAFT_175496 [Aspergillus aurantiobrunneus]
MPRRQKRTREDTATERKDQSKKPKAGLAAYPAEVQRKATKVVADVLASIYYDINYVCIMRSNTRWDPSAETVTYYRLEFRESAGLLDLVVGRALNPALYGWSDPRGTFQRLDGFVKEFGWKMLSICTAAEGFRRACREIRHGVIWADLMEKIRENQWSIEVFARSRNLDWRGQLLKYAHLGIQTLDAELRPARKMWEQHPHHIVQSIDRAI